MEGEEGTDPGMRRALDIADAKGVEIIHLLHERGLEIKVHDGSCKPRKFHPRMLSSKYGPPSFICPVCKAPSEAIYVNHPDDDRQRRMKVESFVDACGDLPSATFPFDHDAWDKMLTRLGLDEPEDAYDGPPLTAEETVDKILGKNSKMTPEARAQLLEITKKHFVGLAPSASESTSVEAPQQFNALKVVLILASLFGAMVLLFILAAIWSVSKH